MTVSRNVVEFAGPCGINNADICRRKHIHKVFFVAVQEMIELGGAEEVLGELAGCVGLCEGSFRLHVGMDITTIPEHHDRFAVSIGTAQQTGARSTVWCAA